MEREAVPKSEASRYPRVRARRCRASWKDKTEFAVLIQVTFGGIFKGPLELLERPGREPIDLAGRDTARPARPARLRLQAPKKPPRRGCALRLEWGVHGCP